MENQKILEAIKDARESKKRNFKQSIDLIVNLKNIDLKKNENRIKLEIIIPHNPESKGKVGIIADILASQAKEIENVRVISKDELENLGKNKKLAKGIVKECSYFIAEAPLMPSVGKNLGSILAPRNLMPKPVPPSVNIKPLVEQSRKTIRLQLKDSPAFHLAIGTEDMEDEKIADNANTVIERIISSLPKGREQIKNFVIKLTMGKPAKFTM